MEDLSDRPASEGRSENGEGKSGASWTSTVFVSRWSRRVLQPSRYRLDPIRLQPSDNLQSRVWPTGQLDARPVRRGIRRIDRKRSDASRYTRLGGAINILGGLTTFGIGVLYARGLEQVARAASLQGLSLHFSQFYTAPLVIPVDRLVATLLVMPVFPIATLLVISGLGALATYRMHRPHSIALSTPQQQVSVQTANK